MPVLDNWHYNDFGERNKNPILFLHGFMGSGEDWQPVLSYLSQKYYCLTLDLPGHGQTRIKDPCFYTMPETGNAIIKILDQISVKKCSLVGYSLGGRVALYLALKFPHYFNDIFLESASPGLKIESEQKARRQRDGLLATELEKGDYDQFLQKWYGMPLFSSLKSHPAFNDMFYRRLRNRPDELAVSLRAIGTGSQPSLWSNLSDIKIPMFFIVGEKDAKFKSIAEQMRKACANADIHVMSECGHNTHLEKPHEFAKIIDNCIS